MRKGEAEGPHPHSLSEPSKAPIKGAGALAPGSPLHSRSPYQEGSCQGQTRGPPGSPIGRLCPGGRHLQLSAGPSWLAGILAPPGSSQPSHLFPPPAPLTNPQPRAERGPCRPNPRAQLLPPLPPPWVAGPSGLPPVPRCQESCWASLLGRAKLIPRAYGRRGPVLPGWSQGRGSWHLPWSRAGSWPWARSQQHPDSASGLSGLGCRTREGGAEG